MKPEPLINKIYHKNEEIIWVKMEDIRAACEFYLEYYDRPGVFINHFPEYKDFVVDSFGVYIEGDNMIAYNRWLFKLAFRDILDKGDSNGKS